MLGSSVRKLVFVSLLAACSVADATERSEKIRSLMEAQGLVATFDQQIQAGRAQSKRVADQMLDQLLQGLNPNEEFKHKFRSAVGEFVQQLQPPWSAQQIVDVWSGIYGEQVSDQELDELLAFYRSPLGKKEVAASRTSLPKFNAYFQERYKPILEKATAAYVERLKAIAADCHCNKARPATHPSSGHP